MSREDVYQLRFVYPMCSKDLNNLLEKYRKGK
jgi:hypothetical protein